MGQTTWTLDLRDRASTKAKRMSRDLRDLALALQGVEASAERADRSLMRMGRTSTASAQRETQAARETARANREVAASIRERERAEGRASRRRTANNGGPTRVDGMFSQREAARLRAMGDANQRRFARDRQQRERDQARADALTQRRDEQRNIRFFQSRARAQQRSFRETERHNRALNLRMQRDQRAQAQAEARAAREAARRRREQGQVNTRYWREQRTAANESRSQWAGIGSVFGGVLGSFGAIYSLAASVRDMAINIGLQFAQVAFQIGAAVAQMVAFREATLNTLSIVARDAQGNQLRGLAARQMAVGQFRFAQQLAQETPLEVSDVIGYQRRISGAGIYGRENRDLLLAATDVGSFNPDPGSAENFIRQMAQMHGSSRLQMQDYGAAADAAGIGRNDVLRRAAANAGITQRQGERDAAYQRRIRQAQNNGRITGRHGYNAMLELLRERSPTGQLGDVARSSAGTLSGALSNFAAIPRDLIMGIDGIEQSAGVRQLVVALNQVTRSLSGASKQGQRFRLLILGITNDFGKLLTAFTGKGGKGESPFDAIFGEGIDQALELARVVREFGAAYYNGFAGSGGLDTLRELLDLIRSLRDDTSTAGGVATLMGVRFAESLRVVVALSREALGNVRDLQAIALAGQLQSTVGAMAEEARIAMIAETSPLGAMDPRVLAHDMSGGEGAAGVERAVAAGTRSMVSNRSQTNNTTININGAADPAQTGGEVEQAVERALTRQAMAG